MLGQRKGMPWAILHGVGIQSMANWMQLSPSNRDKLYEDARKFRNGRKMLDLVDKVVYSVPISNGEEGEWFGQCGDAGKVINAKGIGKNGKIIQLGSVVAGAR